MKTIAILVSVLLRASIIPGCLEGETKISVGGADENWWINYKDNRQSNAGGAVNHPQWVLDTLESKPVVFVVHRTGCGPCTPQADRMNEISKEYSSKITFLDLDLSGDSAEYNQAMSCVAYDPNGGQTLIALTGMITKVKDASGNVAVGWHAWEGDMGEEEIRNWIEDAIAHYQNNG